jgi:galactokinase
MVQHNELQGRIDALAALFKNEHPDAKEVAIFNAPGRINLIGEHTDYNGGYVLPVAIDISILAAAAKRGDRIVNLKSLNFPGNIAASLDNLSYDKERDWANYPLGAAWALQNSGVDLQGADIVFQGDIPLGSGLSSSAAIEVLMMTVLLELSGVTLEKKQVPVLCRKGENDFIGVKSGIMDQFIITFGKENHALFLNCDTLEPRLIPFSNANETVIVVADTRVKRELAKSAYNQRVEECAQGVELLKQHLGRTDITSLSNVGSKEFEQVRPHLPDLIARRCEHVIFENARVLDAVDALETGNLVQLGKLLIASHNSLRDLYEVSCGELDTMVTSFMQSEGVYGARMTGAGFGGSAIALVKAEYKDEVIDRTRRSYKEKTGIDGMFHVCRISDGAGKLGTV